MIVLQWVQHVCPIATWEHGEWQASAIPRVSSIRAALDLLGRETTRPEAFETGWAMESLIARQCDGNYDPVWQLRACLFARQHAANLRTYEITRARVPVTVADLATVDLGGYWAANRHPDVTGYEELAIDAGALDKAAQRALLVYQALYYPGTIDT